MHLGISHHLMVGLREVLERDGNFETSDPREVSQYMRLLASSCQTVWDKRTEYITRDGDKRFVGTMQIIMYGNASTDISRYVIYRETISMPISIEEEEDLEEVEIICRELRDCGPEEFLEYANEANEAMEEEFRMLESSDFSA